MEQIQFCIFISLFVMCQSITTSFETQTPVCPDSHNRAFANGRKCCSFNKDDQSADNVLSRYHHFCPSQNSIDCPTGNDCDDSPSFCDASFELAGFGPHIDGHYSSNDPSTDIELFEEGKRIYILESDDTKSLNVKCIWWYQRYRQWNLGDCTNVGTEESLAYIDEDVPCPYSNDVPWRDSETGEFFDDIQAFKTMKEENWGASFNDVTKLSATVGMTNGIVRNGILRQFCLWRFQNQRWKCVKN